MIDRLTSLLKEESRTPAPHPCLSFALSSHLAETLVRVSSAVPHEAIIGAAIGAFSIVIDGDDDVLNDEHFAQCLLSITDTSSAAERMHIGLDTEAAMVEHRFEVAAKIRMQPGILPTWFRRKSAARNMSVAAGAEDIHTGSTESHASYKDDFPLFYSLMDYVHYESPIGDFARTGLLYIIEAASSVPELERWVIESDLATLMASGLGALYSQLSR